MNADAARSLDPPAQAALVAVLQDELGSDLGRILGAIGPSVPAAAWDRALLEPLRDFLGRDGKRFRARFVRTCWALAGREDEPPELLPLLVEYVHAGSLVVDDIQDGSVVRRGDDALHVRYGVPLAVNAGNWLYFFPLVLLERLDLPAERELALHRAMSRAMLRCHFGQALDLSVRCWDWSAEQLPGLVSAICELKTATLFELSAILAAEAAGASPERTAVLCRFARALGTALQRLDDLGNLRAGRAGSGTSGQVDPKRHEDLRAGRATHVWALAASTPALGALQAQARDVANNDGDVLALARALDRTVGTPGRIDAVAELATEMATLRATVGDHPALDALADETARLEASYG